ncbi:unnamed protein product [Linum trigynum]|uniref:Uncharacterized protein n=1 Tax=Linum trigynum TaxID=586398 RepID=A0AAV2FGL4_9ROSI
MDQEETEARYTIKSKKLSCRLSRTVHGGGSWLRWWKQIKPIYDAADDYILRNVEFEARAREITAIAGPSGAVLVNERQMNASWFRRISECITVVLTIHQPGFRVLKLLDRILLLSNGATLYEGTLASLEERLISAGCCILRHVNVLEFAIDVLKNLRRDGERSEDHHSSDADELRYDVHIKQTRASYSNGRFKEEVWILG